MRSLVLACFGHMRHRRGVLPAGNARQVASFKDALRTAPTRLFTFQYMADELRGELDSPRIKSLLKRMFETGGIGVRNGQHTDFVSVARRATGSQRGTSSCSTMP